MLCTSLRAHLGVTRRSTPTHLALAGAVHADTVFTVHGADLHGTVHTGPEPNAVTFAHLAQAVPSAVARAQLL